ncbi:hypothetical protein BA895_13745 [Humibacillus sp. DSM 29435]|uniref:hypothetical protein n=1 Tax=Humibacillus sp. DSM 29435 TaxID=1869167 RepID=UPI00087320D5|nr:hypothetical protein [Humibacillus sp. DSM 29435]OFE17856.1 hypothetical protein BA895_13745 [Humibacillus sp. DSM 29435]
MNPVFDPASGRIRLDATTFETLCREFDSPSPPGSAPASDVTPLAPLRTSGALVDGVVHEALRPALAAVQRPIAMVHLVVAGAAGRQLHQGWLSVVSAVLADLGDGSYDFAAVGTEFVPTLVARLTRLGLRPHLPAGRVPVTEAVLDGLAAHKAAPRAAAAQALVSTTASVWPAWSAAVSAGDWRFWVVDVTWPERAGGAASASSGRRLAVLDTSAGLLRVDVDDSGPMLVAVTPTEVWRLLSGMLPGDDDLSPGLLVQPDRAVSRT